MPASSTLASGRAAPPGPIPRPRASQPGPGHHAVRAAHDHPRHDRGEHRAAAHPGRAALLHRRPVLGAERVHAHVRRAAAARRAGRGHPRPAPDVPGRDHPVHPGLAGRRAGHRGLVAAGRPRPAGRRRRAGLTRRARPGGGQLPGGPGADPGARRLLRGADGRRLAGPGAGRGDHRMGVLALGAVRQRPGRHPGRRRDPAVHHRVAAPARAVRPGRRAHLDRRDDRAGVRVHPGRVGRLGRPDGAGRVRRGGGAAGHVPADRVADRAADHAAAAVRQPEPVRFLPDPAAAGRGHVRDVLLPDPVRAGDPGLQPARRRDRVPAHDADRVRGVPAGAAAAAPVRRRPG